MKPLFTSILVAHDGTACSDLALDHAIELGKTFGSHLIACHATDYLPAAVAMSNAVLVSPAPMLSAIDEESARVEDHILAQVNVQTWTISLTS